MSWMPYARLSGGGNDFLALVNPANLPTPEQVQAWCRRGVSLGADGVLVLQRDAPETTRVRLTYFNADGGRADLCVNGTRSAAQLAFQMGWATEQIVMITDVGPLLAKSISTEEVELEAPLPEASPEPLDLDGTAGFLCHVGVPHFVVIRDRLEQIDVEALSPQLRAHPALGAEGANVDFIAFDEGALLVRTFERGIEGETLACGSGILAAAWVGLSQGHLSFPIPVRTRGGRPLRVVGSMEGGEIGSWSLAGDARVVSRGELSTSAAGAKTSPI